MKKFTCALSVLMLTSFALKKEKGFRPYNVKDFEKTMKYIPMGTFHSGAGGDVAWPLQDDVRELGVRTVESFYMCDHEVMNGEYLEFLGDIGKSNPELYWKMLPDTLVWRDKIVYGGAYEELYFRHPAYRSFPVVGVTHEQAEAYCRWVTERYAREKSRKFTSAVFSLPTEVQWTYAAQSGFDYAPFPWGGPYLQNKKGQWLANFTMIPQQEIAFANIRIQRADGVGEEKRIRIAGDGYTTSSTADHTAHVYSYFPSDYGLYNMAGNVEEFVKEKGICKGGSWKDTGYYLQNFVFQRYDSTSEATSERGFRIMMAVAQANPEQ